MSDPILPKRQWPAGIQQASVPANDNALRDEAMERPCLGVANDASGSDANGDLWIVGDTPAGAFATFDENDVALYQFDSWYAWAPTDGLRLIVDGVPMVYVGGSTNAWENDTSDGIPDAPSDGTGYVRKDGAWAAESGGGGGGTPGGSDKQVQYNNSGAFGGEAGFEYDASTNTLTVSNIATAGLILTAASATGGAGFRLPHGAAPTSPTNGDVWTTTAGMYVQVNGATVGPLAISGGGGGSLTNWTEAANSSSPNTSVPVVSFTATNAATNVDAALIAKGAGATVASVADNLATGGAKRGSAATDWQKTRNNAGQVASGAAAVISGGSYNSATSINTTVAGGTLNSASNNYAAIGGGSSNTASGINAAVAGGASNTATGDYSWIPGGNRASTYGLLGFGAWSSVFFGSTGTAQHMCTVMGYNTTNATPTALSTNALAAGAANQVVLQNNSAFVVKATVVCRENATGDSASWDVVVHAKRGANAAATSIVGTASVTAIEADAGAATWTVAVSADTTNGCVKFEVTGEASHSIKWVTDVYAIAVVVG